MQAGAAHEGHLRGTDRRRACRLSRQVAVVNDQIVRATYIDQPLSISYDGMVIPLGFNTAPVRPRSEAAAAVEYPIQYPNSEGYPGSAASAPSAIS